jgi:RND family efflux transporter MFP subunit
MTYGLVAARVALIVWAGFGMIGSTALAQGGPPPAQVFVETAGLEELVDARGVTGEIRSRRRAELAAQVAGLVMELEVEEGDAVTKGSVVATLDDERALAVLDRAKAEIETAQAEVEQRTAELDEAERDLERLRELEERGSMNPAEMDGAVTLVASRRALLAAARADLQTARADLRLAERELRDMTIEAPFDGRVVVKHTEIGEWLGVGDPVVTIVSLTELEARIDVPESFLWALESSDDPVQLRLPAVQGAMEAEVIRVVPEADSLSRLFPVRLKVKDPEGVLRPGMSLTAMVPTGRKEALLTVSKDAILRNAAGEYVYINSGGVAAVAPIERRFAVGDRVVIRSPMVREGVQVVVEGNERLMPGQPLVILNGDGGGAPGGGPGGGSGEQAGAGGTEGEG